MSYHVVAILLGRQIIGRRKDWLDHSLIDLGSSELFEHTLDDATSSFVPAELEHLGLYKGHEELYLVGRQVKNNALNHVITFLAVHHFNEHLLGESLDNLKLFLKREPYECFLDDPTTELVE